MWALCWCSGAIRAIRHFKSVRSSGRVRSEAHASFTVGRGITVKGGWPTVIAALAEAPQQVETEEEARGAVRAMADKKVDAIKIWIDDVGGRIPKISPELYGAAIDEAKKHGLPVLAHVFYLADAKELVKAGITGFAHSVRDEPIDDALVSAMKARDVFYIPTLVAHEVGFSYADVPAWEVSRYGAKRLRRCDRQTEERRLCRGAKNEPGLPAAREQFAIALENVKKLADAGVRIVLGTDSGTTNRFPGYFEHRELELMVDAGLSPLQAIEAGTTVGGEILGLKNAGTLAAGSDASFIVVDGDPSTDIRATRNIENVYVRGEVLP